MLNIKKRLTFGSPKGSLQIFTTQPHSTSVSGCLDYLFGGIPTDQNIMPWWEAQSSFELLSNGNISRDLCAGSLLLPKWKTPCATRTQLGSYVVSFPEQVPVSELALLRSLFLPNRSHGAYLRRTLSPLFDLLFITS